MCLPELLLSRSADFASEVEGGRPHEGLLNYMADHTEGSLQQDIQQLLALYQHSGGLAHQEFWTTQLEFFSTKFIKKPLNSQINLPEL